MSARGSTGVAGLALLVAIVAAPPAKGQALAEEARTRARARLDEGSDLLQNGDFAAALERFRQAHGIYPSPKIFFNMGLALRGLARNAEAVEAFQKFIAEATDAAEEPRAQARQMLAELEPTIAWLEITSDAEGAEVSIDGRSFGTTPVGRPVPIDVGPRHVLVQKEGMTPFMEKIEPVAGARVKVSAALTARRPDGAGSSPGTELGAAGRNHDRTEPVALYKRWWFWAAVAALAAAAGSAAFLASRHPSLEEGSLGKKDLR